MSTVLENKILLSKAAVVIFSVCLIYYSDLSIIFSRALEFSTGNISNYVITIPFLSAFIIYRKRNILRGVASFGNGNSSSRVRLDDVVGITLCSIAVILYIAGSATLYATEYHVLSMPIFLAGSTILVFNITTFRHAVVAIMLTFYLQPPPGQIISELAADLSWTSAVLVQGFLGSLGLPISLDSSLGAPALVIENSDGLKTPFFVGEPSSGVFSTIGLSLFAVFVAYIIRGPTWKRVLLFASGFPLFYLLNTLRIAIVISIWYLWGQEASEIYHTISGSSMVAIGTLIILLVGEKIFKLNIRTPPATSIRCKTCNKCLMASESMCLSCGRILGKIRQSFSKSIERIAVVIFIALITSSAIVFTTYEGGSDSSRKLFDLDMKKVIGPETTEYFLPQVSGWNLKYAYRDTRVESILNQDAALAYRYTEIRPIESSNQAADSSPSIYSTVQISTGHHTWEDSLVTYPSRVGRPGATLLESQDIDITGEIQGRFLLFNRIGSPSTEAVVYWFERAPLKFGSNFENRNVLISIWANTDLMVRSGLIERADDSAAIKNLYLSLARPIAEYWHDQTASLSGSNEILSAFLSRHITALIIVTSMPLALFYIYYVLKKASLSSRMHKLYSQLKSEDRHFIDAILQSIAGDKKHCTGNTVAKSYATVSGRELDGDQLTHMLHVAKKAGLVTESIASVNDQSLLVWKINFEVRREEQGNPYIRRIMNWWKVFQLFLTDIYNKSRHIIFISRAMIKRN